LLNYSSVQAFRAISRSPWSTTGSYTKSEAFISCLGEATEGAIPPFSKVSLSASTRPNRTFNFYASFLSLSTVNDYALPSIIVFFSSYRSTIY